MTKDQADEKRLLAAAEARALNGRPRRHGRFKLELKSEVGGGAVKLWHSNKARGARWLWTVTKLGAARALALSFQWWNPRRSLVRGSRGNVRGRAACWISATAAELCKTNPIFWLKIRELERVGTRASKPGRTMTKDQADEKQVLAAAEAPGLIRRRRASRKLQT